MTRDRKVTWSAPANRSWESSRRRPERETLFDRAPLRGRLSGPRSSDRSGHHAAGARPVEDAPASLHAGAVGCQCECDALRRLTHNATLRRPHATTFWPMPRGSITSDERHRALDDGMQRTGRRSRRTGASRSTAAIFDVPARFTAGVASSAALRPKPTTRASPPRSDASIAPIVAGATSAGVARTRYAMSDPIGSIAASG